MIRPLIALAALVPALGCQSIGAKPGKSKTVATASSPLLVLDGDGGGDPPSGSGPRRKATAPKIDDVLRARGLWCSWSLALVVSGAGCLEL